MGLGDRESGAGTPGSSCGTDRRGACIQGPLGKLTTAYRQAPLKFRSSSCFSCRRPKVRGARRDQGSERSESILEKG